MSRPPATTSSTQFVTRSAFAALAVEDVEDSEDELVREEHLPPSSDTYVLSFMLKYLSTHRARIARNHPSCQSHNSKSCKNMHAQRSGNKRKLQPGLQQQRIRRGPPLRWNSPSHVPWLSLTRRSFHPKRSMRHLDLTSRPTRTTFPLFQNPHDLTLNSTVTFRRL